MRQFVEATRSDLRNGLTGRQRTFVLEKLVGLNDKDAALSAGYSLRVAENTKRRIWKLQVRAEWKQLQAVMVVTTLCRPPTTIHYRRIAFVSAIFHQHATLSVQNRAVASAGDENT
jgi:hypothetical protein